MSLEAAEQDQEFSEKITEPRQAQRRQYKEKSELRQVGKPPPQTAHFPLIAGFEPFVEFSAENEQARGADTVRQDLHDHSLKRHFGAGKNSQHNEAHVADRGVGHQAFGVVLAEGANRAVYDAQHAKPHCYGSELCGGGREQRQQKAQQAIGRRLQEYSGKNHRAGGRRL